MVPRRSLSRDRVRDPSGESADDDDDDPEKARESSESMTQSPPAVRFLL
jgi:hypothetical protein